MSTSESEEEEESSLGIFDAVAFPGAFVVVFDDPWAAPVLVVVLAKAPRPSGSLITFLYLAKDSFMFSMSMGLLEEPV